MIKVTIELIPGGIGKSVHLGTMHIANEGGFKSDTKGDYIVEAFDKAGRKWKSGTVKDFPRKRMLAFDLVYRALFDLIGHRNIYKSLE